MIMQIGENEKYSIDDILSNLATLKKVYDLGYKLKSDFQLQLSSRIENYLDSESSFVCDVLEILMDGNIQATKLTTEGIETYFEFPDEVIEELNNYFFSLVELKIGNTDISEITLNKIAMEIGESVKESMSDSMANNYISEFQKIGPETLSYVSMDNKKICFLAGESLCELAEIDVDKIIEILQGEDNYGK